ncbi:MULTISPECIES: succinylglutamate desuccinylase/aspartoacylase family protein [Thalassospira]|jgi:predicted deacylase|uniref:succinylglutamate desuccinylase/aspartoacylase family protein n=1 Tax=Thalassospira TaxID=168934 RepID=UPI0009FC5005|nr:MULTISPECIES: succinylglutamate desuccinylase/aspartoacylase family protein [Thalassospira]|tara:strand:- start:5416 stop:6510 length:1095 start_codon:yes stop_codon:yes gene_type:complete
MSEAGSSTGKGKASKARTPKAPDFEIGGQKVAPGTRQLVDIPISLLSNHTPVNLTVSVVHGKRPGPVIFVSGAVHGDEIVGVEVIRRVLKSSALRGMRGTLLAVPVVNAFGFLNHTRYLPDRRDLNRSFPGHSRGSLAGQLAHLFLSEIVERSDFGIDLHTAAVNRVNLPQIRVNEDDPEIMSFAEAFGAPIILTSPLRDGSLREAARELGVPILLYEAGEGLRFDEMSIRAGVSGVLRVMRKLGMTSQRTVREPRVPSFKSSNSHWLRAPAGGILRTFKLAGDFVHAGDVVAAVSDPFGQRDEDIFAREDGLIIGRTNLPIVNQGDALFHVASIKRPSEVQERMDAIETHLQSDPLLDEDEII